MNIREKGQRRVAVMTAGLAAAGVLGTAGVAALAHNASQPASTTVDDDPTNPNTDSGNGTDPNEQGNGFPFDNGGSLSGSDRSGHATSGGS
jgi:hypothetical protein